MRLQRERCIIVKHVMQQKVIFLYALQPLYLTLFLKSRADEVRAQQLFFACVQVMLKCRYSRLYTSDRTEDEVAILL